MNAMKYICRLIFVVKSLSTEPQTEDRATCEGGARHQQEASYWNSPYFLFMLLIDFFYWLRVRGWLVSSTYWVWCCHQAGLRSVGVAVLRYYVNIIFVQSCSELIQQWCVRARTMVMIILISYDVTTEMLIWSNHIKISIKKNNDTKYVNPNCKCID